MLRRLGAILMPLIRTLTTVDRTKFCCAGSFNDMMSWYSAVEQVFSSKTRKASRGHIRTGLNILLNSGPAWMTKLVHLTWNRLCFPNPIVILHQIVKIGKQLSAPPSLRRSPMHGGDLTMSCARPRVFESMPCLNFSLLCRSSH